MDCVIEYGFGKNHKHRKVMPVADAFRFMKNEGRGYLFYNIYYNDRLVYTDTGCAGYRYICKDCPYREKGN